MNDMKEIIDFQEQKFLKMVEQICAHPYLYLNFDTVADFYQAEWVQSLPETYQYCCIGLDDGAEYFSISIQFKQHRLLAHIAEQIDVQYRCEK